jgi:hypothetical protein
MTVSESGGLINTRLLGYGLGRAENIDTMSSKISLQIKFEFILFYMA